jgi:hypothetical protein
MQTNASIETRRYPDWLTRSIVSGFAATMVMTGTLLLGYTIASVFAGITPAATASGQTMGSWFRGLTVNPLVDFTQSTLYIALMLHLGIGLVWAGVYGYWAQPWLSGPDWQRGMMFSLFPWVLSLTVFFPLVGAGFLGTALGAGPLPILGNLIAHLAYGATLGAIYGPIGDTILAERPSPGETTTEITRTDVMGARGIIVGLFVGVVFGVIFELITSTSLVGMPPLAMVLAAAAIGAAMGELIGSWMGLSAQVQRR